jgi:hypothetical protein
VGCVLQPGEVNSVAALQPGQTTSDAVQPGQDIDVCVVGPAPVPLVIAFDQALYDFDFFIGPSPSGIVGMVFENNGDITRLEDGFPAGIMGTWFTGDTPAIDLNDYDIMYDQQNAEAPNQGFSLVNQWLSMGGGGGDAGQWRYEPAYPGTDGGPQLQCLAIMRIRDAGTLIEIDTADIILQVTN